MGIREFFPDHSFGEKGAKKGQPGKSDGGLISRVHTVLSGYEFRRLVLHFDVPENSSRTNPILLHGSAFFQKYHFRRFVLQRGVVRKLRSV